jgi:hypothetical protein
MNLNVRVKGQHVDFEEKTYYASFSGELEASASPMWALVSHLKDSNTREYTVNVLKHCLTAIREWMEDVEFDSQDKVRFSLLLGEKPGLVVRAEGSRPRGRGFESRCILDGCKLAITYSMKKEIKVASQMGHIKKDFKKRFS